MKEETINRTKLGLFILVGTVLLILGLYYIGSQKNIFHNTITVSAGFNNVNGLIPGNNVRFNGINAGTVSRLKNVSDTLVMVEFTIDEDLARLVSDQAIVSIGTDGLLGNKLLNISPSYGNASRVKEGSVLPSVNPLEIDNTLRSLTNTSENVEVITRNLKAISGGVNGTGSLWGLMKDTDISKNVKSSFGNLEMMTTQALSVSTDLKAIMAGIRSGKGSVGALTSDTLMAWRIRQIVVKFENLNDSLATVTGDVAYLLRSLKMGKGSMGILLKDTMVLHNLNKSILSIDTAADSFNDNMKAMRRTWPFKKGAVK